MTVHRGHPHVPSDVAIAASRIREHAISAENWLHDQGAISIVNSDALGMGRVAETARRTWQLAHVQAGLAGETGPDVANNARVLRYLAKLTINPAVAHGLAAHVGSVAPGRLADIVLWNPAWFGAQPELVIKSGFVAWGAAGSGSGSTRLTQPRRMHAFYGGQGAAPARLAHVFVAQQCLDDSMVRIGAVKIFLDGSLVARTAAMVEPFCDRHSHGYFQSDPDAMRELIVSAHATGWQVAAHAIGDRAVDLALDVFAQAQARHPRPDVRHRIEHAAVTSDEQIGRMAALGVTPVPQARFLAEIGDTMAAAVGPDRVDRLYRHASFLSAGLRVPGSSDRPVASGAPLLGMQSMVQRLAASGTVIGPDERVDALTALRAYTVDTAWIAGEERERGTLAPGKRADLVLLGDDVAAVPADRIGGIDVLATVVGGRCIHGAATFGLEES
jgi:predicted amidohydrolase YtcJ